MAHYSLMENNVFKRHHTVSKVQLLKLQKVFPSWNFDFSSGGEQHPHPLGAAERAICEELVYRDIGRLGGNLVITDIGGNANRHASMQRKNVHSCNPILSSDDVLRRSNYRVDASYCDKKVQDCKIVPDVYMSVHSLYYLSPYEILDLVHRSKKGCLFAVVHRFDNFYGTLHDNGDFIESKYEVEDVNGLLHVRMNVTGNFTGYTHSAMQWLCTSYFHSGRRAMAWNGYPVGDSWIIKFAVAPLGLQSDLYKPLPLLTSLNRNDHHGPVSGVLSPGDEATFKPMMEFLHFRQSHIKSFGSYMWISRGKAKAVMVPKDLVRLVAVDMVGVPRDKAGLRLCINKMRARVKSSKISIPAEMRLICCTYGAALAFVFGLEDEILAFNKLCSPSYKRLYAALIQVMSFERFGGCCCFGRGDSWVDPATALVYNEDRSSLAGPMFDAKRAWPEGLPGVESNMELAPTKEKAVIKNGSREFIDDKPQFFPVAITFSNYLPVVPYASHNNETVACNNRAIVSTPKADASAWAYVHACSRNECKDLPFISNDDVEGDFVAWNSKFKDSRRKNQLRAWEALKRDGLEPNDLIRKSFVKRELTMKGGEEFQDFDPRFIQGNTDKLNVATGPFFNQFSKALCAKWNKNYKITYTSGLTGEEVGSWRDQFSDDDVTIVEIDESRFDAHQGMDAHMNQRIAFEHCGLADYLYAMDGNNSMRRIRGYSSKGVKYSVPYTVPSGDATTSCGNSWTTGIKALSFMNKFYPLEEWKMVVCGDDTLIVIEGHMSTETKVHLKTDLVKFNLSLGFKTKVKVSHYWSDVEFCSSLFWPTADGTVLGPKIGKRLPKIGFSLRDLDLGEVKGMLLGLNIEAGHVPVIRLYAKHCLKFLRRTEKKEYTDDRFWKSMSQKKHFMCEATDIFFMERYGVCPKIAENILDRCLTNTSLTSCVDYSFMDIFTGADL